jgi:phosphatidylglycerol lysyltransferase
VGRWLAAIRAETHPGKALVGKLTAAAPTVLSLMTFLSGALLLLTGQISNQKRLDWLANLLPLAFIETSSFLASVVGAALLILAWGLQRRVRLAYQLTRALFLAGMLLSLTRGLDFQVTLLFGVVLLLLWSGDEHFPSTASRSSEPMSWGWVFVMASVGLSALWLASAQRSVDIEGQLWWRFTIEGRAPRSLRAAVGAGVVMILFAVIRLLRGSESTAADVARS